MFSKIRTAVQTATTLNHAAENVTEEIAAVKEHFEEHKESYLVGASCLTVGLAIGMGVAGKNGGSNVAKQYVIALRVDNVTQNVTQTLTH